MCIRDRAIRTPAPYKTSFDSYKRYDESANTSMDGASDLGDDVDGGIWGQYIYLTWFRVSDKDWSGELNFITNHPHEQVRTNAGTDENDKVNTNMMVNDAPTGSEPFYGMNWSRDVIGAIEGSSWKWTSGESGNLANIDEIESVSYTHLTLPTILLV